MEAKGKSQSPGATRCTTRPPAQLAASPTGAAPPAAMADAAPTKGEEAAAVEDEQPRSTAPLYLITGASGFLGYHLVRQLVEDGASVKIFDLNPPGSSRETRSPVGPRASLVSFPLAAARARCRGRASSCNVDSSC